MENNKFSLTRNRGYYLRTVILVLICVVIVFFQRWDRADAVPIVLNLGGITFSTTDFFMILAAGICGYVYGVGGFVLLFVLELIMPRETAYNTFFTMFVYLVLVLMSGYFAKNRWYRGWIRPLLAILAFTIFLGSSLYVLMVFLVRNNFGVYAGNSFVQMYVGVIPEIALAVAVITLFYRFAPDKIKEGIGEGFRYTEAFLKFLKEMPDRSESVMGKRVSFLVIVQSILISIFAVVVFNFQIKGMVGEAMPRGMELFIMDIQLTLLICCIAFPIAVIVRVIVGWLMVRPINLMTRVMKQYFSSGEESRKSSEEELDRLSVDTGDEVEELYHALRLMVADMSDYIQAMQREIELKENLAAAEAESRAKSTFLSSMSHEIRTPINAVLGMDEMILRESGEEKILEYAENIRTAGSSLLELINDILDFSKIEAGKMDIIPVNYEVASVLNDLVNMIRQRAEDKGLQLLVEADEEIPSVLYGDEIRLKQVVTNILTNAVKYTESGSVTITVRADKIDDETISLFVSVRDTGIGIKKEDLQKLFSAFERIEEKRNRNVEGTGLGMNITRQLLSMMGSELKVESEYGKGSIFSFHLRQKVVEWKAIGDFKETFRQSLANRKRYHESFTAPEARVLVVDDTRMNLEVFAGLLKQTRVQVDMAESGQECLDKITKQKYDIIFLDHRMPEMDGLETRSRMDTLTDNLNREIPVIALTANAVSGAREEYIGYGFTDYLSKPIDSKALEKMMIKYLPKDKVQPGGGEDSQESLDDEEFPTIEGLDWNYAKLHLPTDELLKTALRQFYEVIFVHADRLDEKYRELPAEDAWEEYRILVHGMKSSAATVGIVPLAGMAKILEYAARDKDRERVMAVHDVFLAEWRSYREKLNGVFGLGGEDVPSADYDKDAVNGLLEIIRISMEDFEVDQADVAMEQLKQFQFPQEMREKIQELQTAIADVDSDAVSHIVGELL